MKRNERVNKAIKEGLVEAREDGIFALTDKGMEVVEQMRAEEEQRMLEEMNEMMFQEAMDTLTASRQAALDNELAIYLEHTPSISAYLN